MFENISRWLRRGKSSKDIGKGRLKLILIEDRTGVAPEILDALKEDMFAVISKYFEIKESDVEMNIEKEEDSVALVANIPILGARRQPVSPR